jgi:opacity protein-like surface antigen
LGESLAVQGRLGLSSGEVSGTNVLPAGNSLIGTKTSVLFGLGVEVRPTSNVALTLNYDDYGHLSKSVKAVGDRIELTHRDHAILTHS